MASSVGENVGSAVELQFEEGDAVIEVPVGLPVVVVDVVGLSGRLADGLVVGHLL